MNRPANKFKVGDLVMIEGNHPPRLCIRKIEAAPPPLSDSHWYMVGRLEGGKGSCFCMEHELRKAVMNDVARELAQ